MDPAFYSTRRPPASRGLVCASGFGCESRDLLALWRATGTMWRTCFTLAAQCGGTESVAVGPAMAVSARSHPVTELLAR